MHCFEKQTNKQSQQETWQNAYKSLGAILSAILVRENLCCNSRRCKDGKVVVIS